MVSKAETARRKALLEETCRAQLQRRSACSRQSWRRSSARPMSRPSKALIMMQVSSSPGSMDPDWPNANSQVLLPWQGTIATLVEWGKKELSSWRQTGFSCFTRSGLMLHPPLAGQEQSLGAAAAQVGDSQVVVDCKTGDVRCSEPALKARVETAVRRLMQALEPASPACSVSLGN